MSKLSKRSYARFCDEPTVEDEDGKVAESEIMLLNENEAISLNSFRTKQSKAGRSVPRDTLNTIREYATLVGKRCAPELLYYKS